jgi:hypothetical protein
MSLFANTYSVHFTYYMLKIYASGDETKQESGVVSVVKLDWGGGGWGAATSAAEFIHQKWIFIFLIGQYKFKNKTGLDAKANSELYKSYQVSSVGRGEGWIQIRRQQSALIKKKTKFSSYIKKSRRERLQSHI